MTGPRRLGMTGLMALTLMLGLGPAVAGGGGGGGDGVVVGDPIDTLADAAAEGDVQAVIRLIDAGADVHATYGGSHLQAIHFAAVVGATEVTELLLDHGAAVDAADSQGKTPMHYACEMGRTDTVALLVARGAGLDTVCRERGFVPLHLAIKEDHRDLVVWLLARGADETIPDDRGLMPLHLAIYWGRPGLATLFLDRGAAWDQPSKRGYQPLHVAALRRQPKVVALLLERGADAGVLSATQTTALFYAAQVGDADSLRLLADAGVSIDAPGVIEGEGEPRGWTPLHVAVSADRVAVVAALLELGANQNVQDHQGRTPRMLAKELERERITAMLEGQAQP